MIDPNSIRPQLLEDMYGTDLVQHHGPTLPVLSKEAVVFEPAETTELAYLRRHPESVSLISREETEAANRALSDISLDDLLRRSKGND
jgi:hypothetical protein